jgi:hypothetical protein
MSQETLEEIREQADIRLGTGKGRSGAGFRTRKEQGEWAELCFMARARQLGLNVVKPYGDSASYDVDIENGGRLLRVQIKSTTYARGRTFTCKRAGSKHEPYEEGALDFYALYLVPVDLWYILPFGAARKTSVSIQFTPDREGHKYEEYLEAWHLLRE